jgi:hypothetical protein
MERFSSLILSVVIAGEKLRPQTRAIQPNKSSGLPPRCPRGALANAIGKDSDSPMVAEIEFE